MKECLKKLIAVGLPIPDFAESYSKLLAINAISLKSTDAIKTFAAPYHPTSEQIAAAILELTSPLPPGFVVPTTPNAKEILEFYRFSCPLALVTGGHPPFQWDKLKKAGIDSSVFSMIAIPEDSKKKPYYEAVQREFLIASQDIWVCGDRVAMDLAPAHELGFRTVHMRWGRGMLGEAEKWIDHSISDLCQLKERIK